MKNRALKFYVEGGCSLIPIDSKQSIFPRGWVQTPYRELEDIPRHDINTNFAWVLKDEHLVIDVDPRNFKKGEQPLIKLLEETGLDIETCVGVRSGGGGMHIYLSKPADIKVRHVLPEYKGLEFKTYGSNVTIAGSVHKDTNKIYKFLRKVDFLNLPKAPDRLLQLIRKENIQTINTNEIVINEDISVLEKKLDDYGHTEFVGEGHNRFLVATKMCRDFGASKIAAKKVLKEWDVDNISPRTDDEINAIVDSMYDNPHTPIGIDSAKSEFEPIKDTPQQELTWNKKITKNGEVYLMTTLNCTNFIKMMPELNNLVYDEFDGKVKITTKMPWHTTEMVPAEGLDWKDSDSIQLQVYFADKLDAACDSKEFSIDTIYRAVTSVAKKNNNHPVRNYLNSLKWDGVQRLNGWLSAVVGCEDSEYTRKVGSSLLIAAVARIYKPGTKFDCVPILEGEQGLGKSRLVRALGGAWVNETMLDLSTKDAIEMLRGKWFIELPEMAVFSRNKQSAIKAFVSREVDRCRAPYARYAEDIPRQCVFIGTINPESDGEYLVDPTGGRRYWPIRCRKIDIDKLESIRDQLFAEACVRFKASEEPLYMTGKALEGALAAQEERKVREPWYDTILDFLDKYGDEPIKPDTILQEALGFRPKDVQKRDSSKVGNVMRDLGYTATTKRLNGKVQRVYVKR